MGMHIYVHIVTIMVTIMVTISIIIIDRIALLNEVTIIIGMITAVKAAGGGVHLNHLSLWLLGLLLRMCLQLWLIGPIGISYTPRIFIESIKYIQELY